MITNKELQRLIRRKGRFISEAESRLGSEVASIQKKLLDMIYSEYLGKFDMLDGNLLNTSRNMNLIAELDDLFDKFSSTYQNKVIRGFAEDLTNLTVVTGEYYEGSGIARRTVENISNKMSAIDRSIGISGGKIMKGSYLDRLAQSQEVRQKLKDYIVSSIVQKKNFSEYSAGMGRLIKGSKGINGAVADYWERYAYDSFSQVEATKNAFFAEEVGFDYFIYSGVISKNSRQFCIRRAGGVFSRKDAETWKCDPTLPGSGGGCDESYNFATERGRWNCRHTIDWISEETAKNIGVQTLNFK